MSEFALLNLEAVFARLTPSGWVIPAWLNDLRAQRGLAPLPCYHVIDWSVL